MPLHEDTQNFLDERGAIRERLQQALAGQGEYRAPYVVELQELGDDDEECEIKGRNDGEPPECPDTVAELSWVPPIESLTHPRSFPDSLELYRALNDLKLRGKNPLPTDTMTKLIAWSRQVNLLESYRKMLLHRKQLPCHWLRAWCACLQEEPRARAELELMLEDRPVSTIIQPEPPEAPEE